MEKVKKLVKSNINQVIRANITRNMNNIDHMLADILY